MTKRLTCEKLSELVRCILRRTAERLIRNRSFTESDRKDIEQALRVKLLECLRSFDPQQGHIGSFVTATLERHAVDLLRSKCAAKRDPRRVCSLSVIVAYDEDGPVELSDALSERENNARRCATLRDPFEAADLQTDIADFIRKLPPDLYDLAERLKYDSISQIARELGIPRTTLNDRISKLRSQFVDTDLAEYI